MGATNQTVNYELPIFVGSDKPSWQGDFNGAMSKIDLAMKTIDDKTGDNATAIALLGSAIEDLQNSVRIVADYHETTNYTATETGSRQFLVDWHIVKYSDNTCECHGRSNVLTFSDANPPTKTVWGANGTRMMLGQAKYPENLFIEKPNIMVSWEGGNCPMFLLQDIGGNTIKTGYFAMMSPVTTIGDTPTNFTVQFEFFARGVWRGDNT